MTHGSLFSGVGGFDLAAEWMEWQNVFHCEINPFCQRVLNHYWPNAISYSDIKSTDFTIHRGTIDILTGGFPCQPYSVAGKRLGKEDDRHLWPEMLRGIREIQPPWVVGENVRGLINWNGGLVFDEVQADLEAIGYEVTSFVLPACAVNAPHRRDRIWFVAYSSNYGQQRTDKVKEEHSRRIQEGVEERYESYALHGNGNATNSYNDGSYEAENRQSDSKGNDGDTTGEEAAIKPSGCSGTATRKSRPTNEEFANMSISEFNAAYTYIEGPPRLLCREQQSFSGKKETFKGRKPCGTFTAQGKWQDFPTQSPVCGGDDGLPKSLDGITFSKWRNESIKAYGNAVVPQEVYEIFKVIQLMENEHTF